MSHQRGLSTGEAVKLPHSVSLKVLRLSRPSLSLQHPLPTPSPSPEPDNASTTYPTPSASLAYPSSTPNSFILSPLLTLPPSFGSAYVGETFSCTLYTNNELLASSSTQKTISNVKIEAEMKIPSSGIPVPLTLGPPSPTPGSAPEGTEKDTGVDVQPGTSLQKLVDFDLKEEGSHVLAVTVTYSESTPTSGRVRTFRKLYQFTCKSCLVVRTKTGLLSASPGKPRRWALEAQLENSGEEMITLEAVVLETREGWKSMGINWEVVDEGEIVERPILGPSEVEQVCFVVEEVLGVDGEGKEPEEGRYPFGILSIGWRGVMGNKGFLSTGALGARVK